MKSNYASLVVIPLFVSTFIFAAAVPDTSLPKRKYSSYITLVNGIKLDGYIIGVNDSTVQFLNRSDYRSGNMLNSQTIPAETIFEVKKRFRKGITTGGGILTGLAGGFIIGFGIGLNTDCNDPDGKCDFLDRLFSTKSFLASFIFAGLLGTIGGLIGLFTPKKTKSTFFINGKRENIRDNKNGLLFY